MDKKTIRTMILKKRLGISAQTFSLQSKKICQQLLQHEEIQKATMIGCYVSLPCEVDTHELIQKLLVHHRVCVPKVEGNIMNFYEISSLADLKEGYFHILEPSTSLLVAPWDIDCMIVPLLAYDQKKYRVGYGKGFYDRYFAGRYQGYKIGLAFSFQYVECIDIDKYDQSLNEIICEMP